MSTSTGGFVARSERTSALDVKTATGKLGPGDYNINASRGVVPAAVPFHTSREKTLCDNTTTSAITPGVGSYESSQALDALKLKHVTPTGPTANFVSTGPRLHVDKSTGIAGPGPGTYSGGNEWLKKDHHYKAPPSQQRISFARVQTAPSIPTVHQSYGYEEGSTGGLVMQRPPEPVHSGVGRDTVGPASYNPSSGPAAMKAVAWGKDKRGRKYTTDVPGPGAYNPSKAPTRSHSSPIVVMVNGMEVQFGGTNGTSQFASKVPLLSQRMPADHERTPGPGAYVEGPGVASRAVPLPTDLQFFGSGAKRSFAIDPMKSLSAPSYFRAPGPGTYQEQRNSFSLTRSLAEPLPFASTGRRFGNDANGVPGPGDYRPESVINMTKAQMDKAAVSRGGVFGTAAERFAGRPERDLKAQPSPDTYSPRHEPSPPRHRGDQAVFESKTNRFRAVTAPPTSMDRQRAGNIQMGDTAPRGDPTMLGPGSYSSPDPWNAGAKRHPSSRVSAAFGSESRRSQVAAGTLNTPGPGRYKQSINMTEVFRPFTKASKDTAFGSSGQRSKVTSSFTPGPGHYSGAEGGLAKKTYNITYSGEAVGVM